MDTLSGSVERITFYNPENGYSVLRLRPEAKRTPHTDREGLVTVTGNLPQLAPGENLRLQGKWVNHPKHGLQFQAQYCEQTVPATIAGIRRYLGSGLVKGIGPHLADRIVAHFGKQTMTVIEEAPERLHEVPDIGPKRAAMIASAWEEQKQVKEIMLFLHSYAISTNLAIKIYKQYGENALDIVRSDPYRLATDIYGIGFKTADQIAQALGLARDHPSRIEAGLVYALNRASDDGHVFLPKQELVIQSANLLQSNEELIPDALERLVKDQRVMIDILPFDKSSDKYSPTQKLLPLPSISEIAPHYQISTVYLPALYHCETGIAERLRLLARTLPSNLSDLPPTFTKLDATLSQEQQTAIRTTLSHPVSILTGGPGTGKTTALHALIAVLESAHKLYALASPTGRAAKRLSQATGRSASTVHRMLGFSPGEGFHYNQGNPLKVDLVVIDESSMLDNYLAFNLLKALQPGTHLLLVGDVDQLPSVGAGDVLRDIIASDLAPVTRLKKIFRQAADSQIITNAHHINQGKMPVFSSPGSPEQNDFFLFPAETPEEAAEWVQDVVCNRIPKKFGLHPRDEIQVLSPMYRGPAGVTALNTRIQSALNPPEVIKPEKALYGQVFRVGDKLMQTQNNYDKEVFNGDIGFLFDINTGEQTLGVDFENRTVTYQWNEADQLVLAYAVSVHKSQGSEFPAVVIPLVTQHYLMLQRNLLYTAVTRAKQLCILVGNRRAIGIAVNNDKVTQRYTALDWRLRS